MAIHLPTLNPLWRTDPDDREQVRTFAEAPATGINLQRITIALNLMAEASPAAVLQVQGWIDQVIDLEQTWADKLIDGKSAVASAQEYEGPMPGSTLTRDDLLEQADVVRWNVGLQRVRIVSGGSGNTEGAMLAARISELKYRVLTAVGWDGVRGGARLIRS